jgi:hypothetical protein
VPGLHTVVFQQLSLFTCLPTDLQPVRTALLRWQSLWTLRSDKNHPNLPDADERPSWQDTGFVGQAEEFAWLVLARLDKIEGHTRTAGDAIGLQQATPTVEGPAAAGRLDDTSMTVVTDLMLSLTVGGR